MLTVTYNFENGKSLTETVRGGLFGAWAYALRAELQKKYGDIISITYRGKTVAWETVYKNHVRWA